MTVHTRSPSSAAGSIQPVSTPEDAAMKRDREEWDNEGGAVPLTRSGRTRSRPTASRIRRLDGQLA
jgi:hypothetical protein